jgi:RNA polymerase primary sigma factor
VQAVKSQFDGLSDTRRKAAVVDRLLSRYADSSGCVTEQALTGVAELCRLSPSETDALRSRAALLPEASVPFAGAIAAASRLMEDDRDDAHPDKRILTVAEEVGLGVLLRGGSEHAEREPTPDELSGLPADDLRRRARDTLVLHNQRLVHSIMKTFPQDYPALGYEDMAQEGMLGLMRAARKFKPAIGNKFSTYATWWVRQFISRAINDQSRTIRVPVHVLEDLGKLRKAQRQLSKDGDEPDMAEIAAACGWTVAKAESVKSADRRVVSLDNPVGDDTTLGDLIGERYPVSGADHPAIAAAESARIWHLLGLFPLRDAEVLERSLGLFTGEEETLEQIGNDFEVTRERIRQIKVNALKRLREAYEESPSDPRSALALKLRRPSDTKSAKQPDRRKGPR